MHKRARKCLLSLLTLILFSALPHATLRVPDRPRTPVQDEVVIDGYELTLSRTVVTPDETASLTATLTREGQPVAGATLRLGWNDQYGAFTTDANGEAHLTFTTPAGREVIPVFVDTSEEWGMRLAALFVVPADYGVITITDVTDRAGQIISDFRAQASHFPPGRSWTRYGTPTAHNGTLSLIQPAGLNHVEVICEGSPNYFFYGQVDVPDQGQAFFRPSGLQAMPLTVEATLDGVELSGGRVYLHNLQMPWGPSGGSYGGSYAFTGPVYLFPGTYSVLFISDGGPAVLLEQTGISVTAETTVSITESAQNLATARLRLTDGQNLPLDGQFYVQTADFYVFLYSGVDYLVTPGTAYRLAEVHVDLDEWRYWIRGSEPIAPPRLRS